MTILKSLALAFSCFSGVPVPQVEWNEANMRYMMACFPLVGAVVGVLVLTWWWLCDVAAFGPVLRAAGVVLVPLAVSGGIHLDGFADVIDALSSHAEPERRRAILKDPHIGAFAAMGVAAYMLLYFGIATELPASWPVGVALACLPVLVRCESGFATVAFSGVEEGMLALFRGSAEKRTNFAALAVEYAVTAVLLIAAVPIAGVAAVLVGLACLLFLRPFASKNFGGMSGDVAGFFLSACELVMVGAVMVTAKMVGV